MSDRDFTLAQERQLEAARTALNDPATRRQLSTALEILVEAHRSVAVTTSTAVDTVGRALQPLVDVASHLMETIDLDRVRTVLRLAGEAFRQLEPPNARALGADYWPTLQRLGLEEQLCLSWIPGVDLARALCEAEERGHRETLLAGSSAEILEACQVALERVRSSLDEADDDDAWPTQLRDVVDVLGACVAAALQGHTAAAQALATCCSDTLMTQHIAAGKGRKPHGFVKSKLKLVEEQQYAALLLGPVLAALDSSMRQDASWGATSGGPDGYSRHATVHAVSARVFSEANTLKSILLATSLLEVSISPLLYVLTAPNSAESDYA